LEGDTVKPLIAGIHEVKTHFSKFVKHVQEGNEVVVLNSDTPVAKLVPYVPAKTERTLGLLKGQIVIKPGFDDLPEGFEVFDE
jgi:prevent-host-death family protein